MVTVADFLERFRGGQRTHVVWFSLFKFLGLILRPRVGPVLVSVLQVLGKNSILLLLGQQPCSINAESILWDDGGVESLCLC